jgi:EmrB/QacA subfamily drug resistance transporter
VFAALAPGLLGVTSDEAGLNVALPRIADQFDATIPEVQWVVLAYILAIGSLMIPVGKVADMVGHRRIYLIGAGVFAIGALAAGAAPGLLTLAGLKAFQGLGSAAIQATSMAILTMAFPRNERGKAMGLFMLVGGSGFILGPLAGGSIISWLGWRWMVWMGIPFGAGALAAGFVLTRGLPDKRAVDGEPFDWLGAGLSSAAVVIFLLVMSNGNAWGWTAPVTLAGLVISAVLVAGFLLWQRRAPFPILPPDLMANRPFAQALSITFLIILGNVPVFMLMPFYIEGVLGHSAVITGAVMAVAAAAFTIIGPVSGLLSDRFDWRIFVSISTVIIAAALVLLSFLGEGSSLGMVFGLSLMLGIGVGLWYSPTTSAALSEVGPSRQGVASSATLMVRYTATVSTLAIAISIVTAMMASRGVEPTLSAVTDAASPAAATAFVDGMSLAFRIGAGVNMVALAVAIAPFGRFRGGRHKRPATQAAAEKTAS